MKQLIIIADKIEGELVSSQILIDGGNVEPLETALHNFRQITGTLIYNYGFDVAETTFDSKKHTSGIEEEENATINQSMKEIIELIGDDYDFSHTCEVAMIVVHTPKTLYVSAVEETQARIIEIPLGNITEAEEIPYRVHMSEIQKAMNDLYYNKIEDNQADAPYAYEFSKGQIEDIMEAATEIKEILDQLGIVLENINEIENLLGELPSNFVISHHMDWKIK